MGRSTYMNILDTAEEHLLEMGEHTYIKNSTQSVWKRTVLDMNS